MNDPSRRTFLATAAAATLASSASAIGPIARNGEAKFKFSLAAYSYRDLLTAKKDAPAKLTLADFIDDCAKFGLEGSELTSYYFPKAVTADYLHQLARQCFRLGLDVSGTAIGNDFGHPPGEERKKQIDAAKQWIDHAATLGAPVIRIFAGHAKKDVTPAQSHSLMVSAIEECCEYAGSRGIHLALENHGGPTADAEGLLKFVRDVQSPWFGVNLDTGNFRGDDIYGQLEQIAPYALNVQVKIVVSGREGKKEPADFARLAKMLRGTGYRGYVVLEYEEAGDPRQECPKFLKELREAFA
jgi:sugar phosphate isomerase/epimerase